MGYCAESAQKPRHTPRIGAPFTTRTTTAEYPHPSRTDAWRTSTCWRCDKRHTAAGRYGSNAAGVKRSVPNPRGWQVLCDGRVEPAIVCGDACSAEVRADLQTRTWTSMPLSTFLLDLVAQFADHRRSWRCGGCRHPERREIDAALLHRSQSQRQIAERWHFPKGTVVNHAMGHLPVAAVLAARPRREAAAR